MTDAAPKPAANPRHKWYIVHAYSNFEKKVAEHIRDQAKNRGRVKGSIRVRHVVMG
mgnify:CR=1 FL=1